MITIITYCTVGLGAVSLIIVWFTISYHDLAHAYGHVSNAAEQLNLHTALYPLVRDGPNELAAAQSIEISRMIYREVVSHYNYVRQKPINKIPAFVMRFKKIQTTAINF